MTVSSLSILEGGIILLTTAIGPCHRPGSTPISLATSQEDAPCDNKETLVVAPEKIDDKAIDPEDISRVIDFGCP